ncbi:MAG: zinc-ribbon and DUF3426 domain-containing protein [Steroidobacteraceae bacterium]
MFTVCSKCNLRLTVTATDLRAAQGYVRCGRCHNVFNALAALADDPARLGEQTAAADTQSRVALKPPEPPAESPAPSPASDAQDDPASTDTSLEFNPASTNINEVFIEPAPNERTGTFESIVLVSEEPADAQEDADPVIAPQALSTPVPAAATGVTDVHKLRDALAEPQLARPTTPEPAAEPAPPLAAAPVASAGVEPAAAEISFTDTSLEPAPAAAPAADEPAGINAAAAAEIATALRANEAPARRPTPADPAPILEQPDQPRAGVPRWVPAGAAAVLVLCLMAQVMHHYRSDLADTAVLRGPLTALYQDLGAPLEPRWNMASYEIRQLGASTDGAAGNLVVRASISNRATRDQPLPLLRVVMQDRFGNRVAARDLKPAEYLGRGAPQVTLLGPGQRIDVQVAMQDPGQVATGFEIDACMPGHDHTVMCANDPGTH